MATLGAVAATSAEDVHPQRFSVTDDDPVWFTRDLFDPGNRTPAEAVMQAMAWLRQREAGA